MSDLQAILIYVAIVAVLGAVGLRGMGLLRAPRWLRRAYAKLEEIGTVNPLEPKAVLLQSADGSITLARMKNGQLRSLKREPKGKTARKLWRRARRRARELSQLSTLSEQLSSR